MKLLIPCLLLILFLASCTTKTAEQSCYADTDCVFNCPKGCLNKAYDVDTGALCKIRAGSCYCIDRTCTFIPA